MIKIEQFLSRGKKRKIQDVDKKEHTEASLRSLFRVYGRIAHIVVRKRRALIVFACKEEAAKATQETPVGLCVNLLDSKLNSSKNDRHSPTINSTFSDEKYESHNEAPTSKVTENKYSSSAFAPSTLTRTSIGFGMKTSSMDDGDYESQTLARLLSEHRKQQATPV